MTSSSVTATHSSDIPRPKTGKGVHYPDLVGTTVGSLHLLRELGTGGHARVFLGRCMVTGERSAVKVLIRREYLERFTQEFRLLDSLDSPHIVRVREFILQPVPHYTMEFLPGFTLETHRKSQGGNLTVPEVLGIARQLCDALEHLHTAGIIHRDLNPKNVIRRPDGFVSLIDLGIAKPLPQYGLGEPITTTHLIGTKGFIAPEQVNDQPVDFKADFYGLGALLYRLLSGELYTGSKVNVEDPQIRGFLENLLASDPEARFNTLDDIRGEIDALLSYTGCVTVVVRRSHNKLLTLLLVMLLTITCALSFSREGVQSSSHQPAGFSTPTEPGPPATGRPSESPTPTEPGPSATALGIVDADPGPIAELPTPPPRSEVTRKRNGRKGKSSRKRKFRAELAEALRTCAAPPQQISFRVARGRVTIEGPQLAVITVDCVVPMVPKIGRFSGKLRHR